MMKVANQKTIQNLALRQFRAGKSRNVFAVIAIILTTVLITAVSTIGISLMDGQKQMMIQMAGRNTEVCFQYLTKDEAALIGQHPLVEKYGLSTIVSGTSKGIFRQNFLEIRTADQNYADFTFQAPTTGKLPEHENEVALTSWILDSMGVPRELGQTVHLDFNVNGTDYGLDLTVCGFWDGDLSLKPYGTAFISDSLAEKLLSGIDSKESVDTGTYHGVIQLEADIAGRGGALYSNVETVLLDTHMDLEYVNAIFNPAYDTSNHSLGIIFAMALIILIILVSGYLLIYNIFYISVTREIKFYGLLKTIGTTRKQTDRVVMMQAILLSCIGIPAGLLLGYLLGVMLIPALLGFINIQYTQTPPNILIFVLAALLALFTVLISCRKPAKTAGKVSPVEAVCYTGIKESFHKKEKKSVNGASLGRMAISNTLRSKKKFSLVIASLSFGLILLNIVFTYISSFDVNKYLQNYIYGDFLIANTDYFNTISGMNPDGTLTEDIVSQINGLEGVETTAKIYFGIGYTDELFNPLVYGMDDYWLDTLAENITEGNFDREKFLSGGYIIVDDYGESLYSIGDSINIKWDGENGTQVQYEIMAKIRNIYALSIHYIAIPGFTAYLPASEFMDQLQHPTIMSATVMANENYLQSLQSEIGQILQDNPDVDFRSRSDYRKELNGENEQLALIGLTLCVIILVIGILNFANTVMTNIIARRQEFAMLQSIGMTTRQCKKMTILECMWYMAFASGIFVTAGYGLSYFIVYTLTYHTTAYTYRFTFIPLILCAPVLAGIAVLLPLAVLRNISKDSVVQRLREIG